MFCKRKSKAPFNGLAKDLLGRLAISMRMNFDCSEEEDIHALFVETEKPCPPFRILFNIRRAIDSSRCRNTSGITRWLDRWSENTLDGNVQLFKTFRADPYLSVTYCSKDASDNVIDDCHRVFYCEKPKKKRTFCLIGSHFKINATDDRNFETYYNGIGPRQLCSVNF